jgi:hypothetical protein
LKVITILNLLAAIVFAVSAVGLGIILNKLAPIPAANVVLFYFDLFALVFSMTFLVGLALRHKFGVREQLRRHIGVSVRQSFWFGLLLVVCFALLSNQLFTWWNTALLVFCLIFLESYFLFK